MITSQVARGDLVATVSSWRERYETHPTGRALDRLGLPAMLILGVTFGIGQALHLTQKPLDFVLYWKATNFADLYPPNWLSNDYAYVYPPPMAQLLLPFHLLPFDVAFTPIGIVHTLHYSVGDNRVDISRDGASTLHLWWARRPLSMSRAVAFAIFSLNEHQQFGHGSSRI